ncbi:MAG: hypothetical protein Q9178_005224 [Gyalolechia marmorata]
MPIRLHVYSDHVYHWLHWRHTSEDGTVSYRAECVGKAFLDDDKEVRKVRSTLINALEWVRGERLAEIREALLKLDPNVGPFCKTRTPPTSPAVVEPPPSLNIPTVSENNNTGTHTTGAS